MCLVYIFLLKRYSRFLFHIRICYDLKISHYLVPRSFLGGTKSLDGKVHYYLPIYIFCMEKQWKFLLYTTIAFYLWVSHDSDPISFGQVQCYWKEKFINRVQATSFFWINFGSSYFTQIANDPRVCNDYNARLFEQFSRSLEWLHINSSLGHIYFIEKHRKFNFT